MLKNEINNENDCMTVKLKGDVDHLSAKELIKIITASIKKYSPKTVKYDFHDLSYADSSIIAVLICTKKALNRKDCNITVTGASQTINKILSFSGLENIIKEKL